ncbi:MAG: hypothetical protein DLM65_12380 [Candidatus Aeolococcus gillhamiae]|uniref:Peptidase C51 domain-containing protein n=1 Tax=Candidatus Aeolococcus gillhamiae TaxID=3127015 RepID=A0A2W6ALQ2_9BACT|nr:MAG: hypothetical protein DLM65_12380 [Candidatus Dormibacter sp. RRmetagenome_bin12]
MSRPLRRVRRITLGLPCGCALLLLALLLALPLLFANVGGGASADASSAGTLRAAGTGVASSGGPVGTPVRTDLRPLFPWTPAGGLATGSWPWGQCTWFVVSQGRQGGSHRVTWSGNAADWYANAEAAGVVVAPASATPEPGWIAVFAPGHGSDSSVGHVAVVVGVQPASGSYTVAEMHVLGLGVADLRTLWLHGTSPLLEGWIA